MNHKLKNVISLELLFQTYLLLLIMKVICIGEIKDSIATGLTTGLMKVYSLIKTIKDVIFSLAQQWVIENIH